MDVNEKVKKLLGEGTGLPVEQDEYSGQENKYITFTYSDERPILHGDNRPIGDEVYLNIQLITPKDFNYMVFKHQIRNLLENADFSVASISSNLGDVYSGTEKMRQTIFEVKYMESRQEETE